MPGPVIPMTKCCNIVSDLLTGVLPGVVDDETPVTPTFITYAMIHDPGEVSFLDWTFVGGLALDGCNFPPPVFNVSTWFGANSEGCYDGAQAVTSWFDEFASNNGTPAPGQASYDREQDNQNTYFFAYEGNNAPPDPQIVDSGATPQTLTWDVIQPRTGSVTFTCDDVTQCHIHAFLYGYDNITTYPFGSFVDTLITDPSWEAYIHGLFPKGSPSVITTSIVGNDVTITVTNMYEYCRGIRWHNNTTLQTGDANFTFI